MSRLTITDEPIVETFAVSASQSVFPFDFAVHGKADMRVSVAGVDLDETGWTLTGTLLDGGGYQGGTVTLNTAVSNTTVCVYRATRPARASNFAPSSKVPVTSVDQALNRLHAIAQDHDRDIDTTIRAPVGEAGFALPAAGYRKHQLLGTAGDGAFALYDIGDFTTGSAMAVMVGLFVDINLLTFDGGVQVIRTSGYAANGRGGAFYVRDAAVNAAYVSANPHTAALSANGVGFRLDTEQDTTPQMFGAVGDGVAFDRAAVQACIDYCLSFPRAKPMHLTALYRIETALIVNRKVGETVGIFRIIADGVNAGFYTNAAGPLFDSTLPDVGAAPQSCLLSFEGVRFEGFNRAQGLTALSWRFFLVKFTNCVFLRCSAVQSTSYLQSWYFLSCEWRDWPGWSASAALAMFDCDWKSCVWEHGDDGVQALGEGGHGVRLIGNLFEGSRRFLKLAGGDGVTVTGNYTEANLEPDYTFAIGEVTAKGVAFFGNTMLQTPDHYNVIPGDCRGFASGGNYCTGKMFDMSNVLFGQLTSMGDNAGGGAVVDHSGLLRFSDNVSRSPGRPVLQSGALDAEQGITAFAAGGQAGARPLRAVMNVVSTAASANASVALPASGDILAGFTRYTVVLNLGANSLRVWQSQQDFLNFGVANYWDIAPGEVRTFYQHGAGLCAASSVGGGGGGGPAVWGSIIGTLSGQSDLQAALNGKLDVSAAPELIRDTMAGALVAGTNVTIAVDDTANTITLSASGGGGASTIGDVTGLQAALDAKAPLVPASRTITANGAVADADHGGWIIVNASAGVTLGVTAGDLRANFECSILQTGAGAATISGVSQRQSKFATAGAGAGVTLKKSGSTVWLIGDLA